VRRSAFALAAAALLLGCSSSPQEPHGSPVLIAVYWAAGGNRALVYESDPDAAVADSVPAAATEVDFVFDRRLDGSRVEGASPPIAVSWPDSAGIMSDPPFGADAFYNSASVFGGQSAYVFLRPHLPGFPSGTTVTFQLDKTKLTSAYGEPMIGPDQIVVSVAPLTVLPGSATSADALPPQALGFMFRVVFTGRMAKPPALAPFTHVTSAGVPVPFSIAADLNDPRAIYISPGGCGARWPAGASIEVNFDPGLPDAFGVPSASALRGGSFSTVAGPVPDAGCTTGDAGTD
jgi:hypothetical protein